MFERASAKRQTARDAGQSENFPRREPTRAPTSGITFVGREAELRHLIEAVDAALIGHGSLVAVIGEPGIGKTALCEQASQYAVRQGIRVLVGYSYQRDRSRPYLPFAQILHRFVAERDLDELRSELENNASEVARIVPDLPVRRGTEPLGSSGDPSDDRLRLFQAVSDFLCAVSERQALMLIFEDLHDADHGTLDLLLHLARNLQGARILVVATYRDVEVDRAHPLSAALAELHRVSQFDGMHLGDLSVDDVQRLLASISEVTVPRPLAELVHRRTGGNPLFAHQLLRFLLSEHLIEERDGALRRVGDKNLAGHMPEALRDVVGRRLSSMSVAANQALTVASVIGREFQLEVLQRVYARPEEELESALEEAVSAGLVEERSVVGATIIYRFSHAFFQQTLYDWILAPRRVRLHQQVARVLEEVHARRLGEHAAELAEHYAFSSDTSDLAKAVQYGELAAIRAGEVFAYREAARQLERALAVQGLVDQEDRAKRCDLLLALGAALLPAGEFEHLIVHVAPEALALADGLGDRGRAFRACYLLLECLRTRGWRTGAGLAEYLRWAERARDYANPDSVERIHVAHAFAAIRLAQGRLRETQALRREAVAHARRYDDRELLFKCATQLLYSHTPREWPERVLLAEEAAGWSREAVTGQTLIWLLWYCGRLQLARGERGRSEELWRQLEDVAERTRVASSVLFVPLRDATLATIDGHLEDAIALLQRYAERAPESGAQIRGRHFGVSTLLAPLLLLGRAEDWLTALADSAGSRRHTSYASESTQTGVAPTVVSRPSSRSKVGAELILGGGETSTDLMRCICLAHLGRLDEARALVGDLLDEVEVEVSTEEEEETTLQLLLLLQVAVLLEHRRAAQSLRARLACVADLAICNFLYTCTARHLGDAAALVGDWAAAQAYYVQALEVARKIRFRPEMALAHLNLAKLLVQQETKAAHSAALMHLDSAIPELRDMRMQPALERALVLSNQLQGVAVQATEARWASDTLTARRSRNQT